MTAVEVLAAIADEYDRNALDPPARKFWGLDNEFENLKNPDSIELFNGRGGKCLLTLGDCLRARNERDKSHE